MGTGVLCHDAKPPRPHVSFPADAGGEVVVDEA